MNPNDAEKLRACVAWSKKTAEERDLTETEEKWSEAFANMLERWRPLTEKQRLWVLGVHEQIFDEPEYQNAWSAGKVPLGKSMATPVPAVLLAPLPKRPPGRRP